MRKVEPVEAIFCVDWLAIVKDLENKATFRNVKIVEIFAILQKTQADCGHDVV